MKNIALVLCAIFLELSYSRSLNRNSEVVKNAVSQKIVLVGSKLKDDNDEVWNKIVTLAGGVGVAQFGVVSAVTTPADRTASNNEIIANLIRAGAKSAVTIPVTKAETFDEAAVNEIKNTTGILIVEDVDDIDALVQGFTSSSVLTTLFFGAVRAAVMDLSSVLKEDSIIPPSPAIYKDHTQTVAF